MLLCSWRQKGPNSTEPILQIPLYLLFEYMFSKAHTFPHTHSSTAVIQLQHSLHFMGLKGQRVENQI